MNTVFTLMHEYTTEIPVDDGVIYKDHTKFIGIFSTEENAKLVLEKIKGMPGFRDHPKGFLISQETINQSGWEEGFGGNDEAYD